MTSPGAIGMLLAFATAPLVAQAPSDGRWSVRIERATGLDRGDLRVTGPTGRLLLESDDTLWLPVSNLADSAGRLTFRLPGERLFVGTLESNQIEGLLHDPDDIPLRVSAQRIEPGTVHWPVRPRVTMPELVVGNDASSSRFPDRWRDAILPRDSLLAEDGRLADSLGLPAATAAEIAGRSRSIALGTTTQAHQLASRILEQIATGPAADQEFHRLFGAPGRWRFDIHQVAWQLARSRAGRGHLLPERMIANLVATGILDSGTVDSTNLVEKVWQLERLEPGRKLLGQPLLRSGNDSRLLGLHAVLSAYDDARTWWLESVRWLMTHRWLEGPAGRVSPVELVARFWGDSVLSLPALTLTDFGGVQAVPVIGVGAGWPQLVVPVNGVAAEWLGGRGARTMAFDVWRRIELERSIAMPVVIDSVSLLLSSPAQVVRRRLGGFIDAADRIRIDPSIMPVFAVGTMLHEWQHLRFVAARMNSADHPGWQLHSWGIRLRDGDPWLVEGAAEWATEMVLGGGGAAGQIYRLVEAEKRLALDTIRPDDTHVLGYLLIRSAASRVGSAARMRELLVANLDRPERLADLVGLGGPVSESLTRPNTLMVIPEMSFVVDAGVADEVTHRLLVPEDLPESP